ncbi:MAG: glycosyltransferase family 2 protein [bacterium]|nr:glycosyltransferase family 2 protein [bacterium]
MSKKTAIVLVNYKDYVNRFLVECRDSLRSQNYPKDLFAVYIVDNASSPESRKYIGETYPEAVIVPRSDGNYSAANNAGIKKGAEDGCEYFVIANMDTRFDANWLAELIRALESGSDVGLVQSKILLYPKNQAEWGKLRINSLGNIIHFLGFGMTSFYNEPDREIAGWPEINGYASGCSLAIKKEVLDKIGGYNEEYYMYHDDIEVSWKVKLAGYKIVLAPKSIVYHKYEFSRSMTMVFYMERNRYITVLAFYKPLTLLLILPAMILMDLGVLMYSLAGGWFKVKLKVYGYFLKAESWKKIIKFRQELNSIRRLSDREIVKPFTGKILFQEINNPPLQYIANPLFSAYWAIIKKIIFW